MQRFFLEIPNLKLHFIRRFSLTMIQFIKFAVITIVSLVLGSGAIAQITASASAEATIITPLTITKNVDMNFGNVAVINQVGTVVLSTASGRTSTGGATPVANPTGTVTAASFTVTGGAGYHVFVTLPASPPGINVTHTNGINVMNVTNFICNPATNFTMPVGGSQTLAVGATLNTGISQLPGVYHTLTNFNITVNYN